MGKREQELFPSLYGETREEVDAKYNEFQKAQEQEAETAWQRMAAEIPEALKAKKQRKQFFQMILNDL